MDDTELGKGVAPLPVGVLERAAPAFLPVSRLAQSQIPVLFGGLVSPSFVSIEPVAGEPGSGAALFLGAPAVAQILNVVQVGPKDLVAARHDEL